MSLQQEDRDTVMALVGSVQALVDSVAQLTACVADLLAEREDEEAAAKPDAGQGLDDDDD